MKKTLYYLLFFVIASIAVIYFWTYDKYIKSEPPKYLIFNTQKGDISETISARWEVVYKKRYDLELINSGIVNEILVNEWDLVNKWDLLLKLDTSSFELELKSWSNLLAQSEANLEKLQNWSTIEDVNLHATAVKNAKSNYVNSIKIQEEEVQNGLYNIESAQITLDNSAISLINSKTAIKNSETALANIELVNNTSRLNAYDQLKNVLHKNIITVSSILTKIDNILDINDKYNNRISSLRVYDEQVLRDAELNYKKTALDYEDVFTSYQSIMSKSSEKDISDLKEKVEKLLDNTLLMLNGTKTLLENYITNSQVNSQDIFEIKTLIDSLKININGEINLLNQNIHSINNLLVRSKAEISSAKSNIDMTTANYDEVKAINKKAEIALKLAKQNLSTIKIKSNNQILASEWQIQLEKDRLSRIEAWTRKEDLKIAKAQIDDIKVKIEILNDKIGKSSLYSPFDAKVVNIWVEQWEYLRPSALWSYAISLVSSWYEIQSDISEIDISKIKENDSDNIIIEFDAFPGKQFIWTIISIEPQEITIDWDSYYRVNITINDIDEPLRPWMNADLKIIISTKTNALYIPDLTITKDNDRKFTHMFVNGILEEVEVETWITDWENIEIIKGINHWDKIVIPSD